MARTLAVGREITNAYSGSSFKLIVFREPQVRWYNLGKRKNTNETQRESTDPGIDFNIKP